MKTQHFILFPIFVIFVPVNRHVLKNVISQKRHKRKIRISIEIVHSFSFFCMVHWVYRFMEVAHNEK